jgi:hypothetical protein
VTSKRLSHAIWLVGFLALGGLAAAKAMPAPVAADRAAFTLEDASQHRASQDRASEDRIQLAQAQAQQTPAPDAAAQTDQQGAPEEPIGNVATLTGVATVTRNNTDTPLQLKDDIYLNDVVKTQATSSLSITFNDATTFRLSANAEITIDNYVYEEGGAGNAGTFDIARGTVAFVAAQVAKTGKMEISTPTATLGIRGTTGVVDVPEGVTATSANNVNIKLYPDADGRVGQIEINDRQGARLGALTQGASGFAIRAGAGGARFAAVPIVISPQQQQRDQGFVRQVHSAQNVGRQIVTQQRAFRRANPGRINPNAPRRQGGQQQPGAVPRPGQNALPVNPAQPGAVPRPGQNAPPATPAQPNVQPRPSAAPPLPNGQPILRQGQPQFAPGAPRPGLLNRPALNRPALPRPARQGPPPKDKKKQ